MAMQGKSTSGDKPSLDVAEADQAADAFRPSWAAEDDDDDAWGAPAPSRPGTAAALLNGAVAAPPAPPAPVPTIIASPVISLGPNIPNVNQTVPLPAMSAEAAAAIAATKPFASTQLGISPAAAAVVAAANSANAAPYSQGSTRLGGISPEAAAIVAAANAANAARSPAQSAEAIEPEAILEVAPAVPTSPMTAPMPVAPDSSSPVLDLVSAPSPAVETAPVLAPAPPPAPPVAAAPAVVVPQAAPAKPANAPLPFAAADPFRNDVPAAAESADDLDFVKKKSSKSMLFVGIGAVVLVAAGVAFKVGGASDEPAPKPASSTATGPAILSPTNDIPPPPPKEEIAPAPAQTTAAAKTAEPPPPAKTAEPAPAPKAAEPVPAAKAPEPPKALEPPKPIAAVPPVHHETRAKPVPPPPAPPPAAAPKSPPKSTGGGIVRDSPF